MIPGFEEAITLVGRTAASFALFYLPALAAATFLLRRGCKSTVLIGLVALATTGIFGDVVFWLWLPWPRVGRLFALVAPPLSVLVLIWLVWRLDMSGRRILRALLVPILLSGAFSIFVLSSGFAYGYLNHPLEAANSRFSHPLAGDNAIPFIFAEYLRYGHMQKTTGGAWHSSDRPPLQVGLVLAQTRYFSQHRDLCSQITGVIAQSTWILALWILLTALKIEPSAIALILVACLTSGFVLVNTFFVWPKLLAAAYTLGALTIFCIPKTKATFALCGTLIALALLAHGGAVFAFLGVVVMLPLLRIRVSLKHLAVLLATALLVYAPWIWYQKFYDPPGDALLKLHLAGVQGVNSRPFRQLLVEAYEAKSPREIYDYKWSNWISATDHNAEYWGTLLQFVTSMAAREPAFVSRVAGRVRMLQFFYFFPSLGFLGLGIPALLLGILPRFRTVYWRVAMVVWAFIFAVIVIWCLLMFGPATTVIHQGAYAMVLLAYAGCCLSLWSVSPALAKTAVALQGILDFLLYGPFMQKKISEDQFVPFGDVHIGMVLTAAIAAVGVAWLLYKMAKEKQLYCSAELASSELLAAKTVH